MMLVIMPLKLAINQVKVIKRFLFEWREHKNRQSQFVSGHPGGGLREDLNRNGEIGDTLEQE